MNTSVLSDIEMKISQLSDEEQLWLIERLVHQLQKGRPKAQKISENQLAAMASDPQIQSELRKIRLDFAQTELDGLENV